MLAVVLEKIGEYRLKDVPLPEPQEGTVRIKVKACGICRTDYLALTGKRRNYTPPLITGHEIAGVVDKVGRGVIEWHAGDEVVVAPAGYCGKCHHCRRGLQHYCEFGFGIGGDGFEKVYDGGFAEYTIIPALSLYKKPAGVAFSAAALTEPLAGSYKGLIEYSQMRIGEDVVIIGAGGMGLLLSQIASAGGAGSVIVIDVEDYRLKHALDNGATHIINTRDEDAQAKVKEILPAGPDIIFEAAGALEAAELTMALCRRGTRINMFGVTIPGTIPVSPAEIHFKEITMHASFSITPHAMMGALRLLEKGLVDPGKLITHIIPLQEFERAMAVMESPERVKVVVGERTS